MLDEFDCRVQLENAIRMKIRTAKQGHDPYWYEGQIMAYQKVLEYDDFTIDLITDSIRRQEEKRS